MKEEFKELAKKLIESDLSEKGLMISFKKGRISLSDETFNSIWISKENVFMSRKYLLMILGPENQSLESKWMDELPSLDEFLTLVQEHILGREKHE